MSARRTILGVVFALAVAGISACSSTAPPADEKDLVDTGKDTGGQESRVTPDEEGGDDLRVVPGDASDVVQEDLLGLFVADVGPDLVDVAPQCKPGDGCFLDPCAENKECASAWCIEHLGEDVCTMTCVEECPLGFACAKVAAAEPDVVYACLSLWPRMCLPCTSTQDCKTAETLSGTCVTTDAAQGCFCASFCVADKDCPAGFSCKEATTVEGMATTQCVPDGGVCPCSAKAVAEGLHTLCRRTSQFGVCDGFAQCTESGLSECDAEEPAAEVCDGADNDCDGDLDEGTCDDANPCTSDSCLGEAGCSHEPVANQECTDGDLCTTGDHCEEGECSGNPIACEDGNRSLAEGVGTAPRGNAR